MDKLQFPSVLSLACSTLLFFSEVFPEPRLIKTLFIFFWTYYSRTNFLFLLPGRPLCIRFPFCYSELFNSIFPFYYLGAELNSRWALSESARIQITAIRQTQRQITQNKEKLISNYCLVSNVLHRNLSSIVNIHKEYRTKPYSARSTETSAKFKKKE
jgi:hypothetical protein